MSADLDAGWRFAGPQDHGDRAALLRVVNMNRQKAALVIVRVKERQLLMAMRHVAGVVDVERDRRGRRVVRRHPLIDECVSQADHVAKPRRILEPRQRWLRTQIAPGVRQAPARKFEGRVEPQKIEIVSVLIAAANG